MRYPRIISALVGLVAAGLVAPTASARDGGPLALSPLADDAVASLGEALDAARDHDALRGHAFSALVVDAETGQAIYERAPDTLRIPASNTKLFTTAGALALLGEDHRMVTRAFVDAPIVGEVTPGNLHAHGGHDFTMSRWFFRDPRAPFDRLAARIRRAGVRWVRGDLVLWGAWCYDGHHFGTYAPSAHRKRAQGALAAALRDAGVHVAGRVLTRVTMDDPPGVEVARVASPPLHTAVWPINRTSHNEMADALLRHVGWVVGGESSYEAGGEAIVAWFEGEGVDMEGAVMKDGSGLDVDNRFSARQMVAVYRLMAARAEGPAWRASLSVAGAEGPDSLDGAGEPAVLERAGPYSGTLGWRMTEPHVAGRVRGKSGTNQGISTTGLLDHRYDGRRYAFAFIINGISTGLYGAARDADDATVARLGRPLRPGAPPAPPTLRGLRHTASGVEASWAEPPVDGGAEVLGYHVWTSPDGRVFDADARHFTSETRATLPTPSPGAPLYVRVTAVGAFGESGPTHVYGTRRVDGAGRALIVDGDDHWSSGRADENVRGASHAFVERYVRALDGISVDTVDADRAPASLEGYHAVFWSLGDEVDPARILGAEQRSRLIAYLGGGGRLFISGSSVASGLASDEARAFGRGWLGVTAASADAGTWSAAPVDGAGGDRRPALSFFTPGELFVAAPDALEPAPWSAPRWAYPDAPGFAVVASGWGHRAVTMGVPFEAIDGADVRRDVARWVLTHFGL